MLPSSAANVACLALAGVPSMPTSQARTQSSAACAFCGGTTSWLRRRTRGPSSIAGSSSQVLLRSPPRCSPLLHSDGACWSNTNIFLAKQSRWDYDVDEDEDGVESGGDRRREPRRRRTSPWEDIQWSNVPAARKVRDDSGNRRGGWKEEEVDDDYEEEEVLGLGERRRGGVRSRDDSGLGYYGADSDGENDDDADYDGGGRPRRRRSGSPARPSEGDAEAFSGWNPSWFADAQQANQGGIFSWARSLYNALFWYGGASEDTEQLPAMNFQDLLERYDAFVSDQSSGKPRPIVPPEDLDAEQDYRWRPNGRDSGAAAEGRSRRRSKPRSSTRGFAGNRPARTEEGREAEWEEQRQRPAYRDAPPPRRKAEAAGGRGGGERGPGRKGADPAVIGQLRRKQRQLADRELKFEMDLEKVRERLGVVDATVELWLRRSAGMLARGKAETDTEVLQAKRRIYGLKDEGRQLDSARSELEGRLEDCRFKLDRILQELELLGEDAAPEEFYELDERSVAATGAKGEKEENKGDDLSGVEAEVVEIDGLEFAVKERNMEAVPVIGEAEKESL